MSLTCQLSGNVPAEPVVDRQGHLFERRLIEEQLEKSSRCPIDGAALDKGDLIALTQVPVRAPSAIYAGDFAANVKGIVEHYDNIAMECERLRHERDDLRKEVTRNAYLRDAATAMVASKMNEIEFLKKEVAALTEKFEDATSKRKRPRLESDMVEEDPAEALAANLEKWTSLSQTLLQLRKKRTPHCRPLDQMRKYHLASSQQTSIKEVASMTLVVSATKDGNAVPHLVAVGGRDGEIEIRDVAEDRSVASLNGHDGAVTSLLSLVYPSVSHLSQSALSALGASSGSSKPFRSCMNILSGDDKGVLNIWRETSMRAMDEVAWLVDVETPFGNEKRSNLEALPKSCNFSNQVVHVNKGPINRLKLHPAGTHVAAVTGTWSLVNIVSGAVIRTYDDCSSPIQDIAFQPDGLVVIGASQGTLPVWDLRQPRMKTECRPPDSDASSKFTSVSFSEAGYYMVTATAEGRGHLWDLRKSAVLQTYEIGAPITDARFDYSGLHMVFSSARGVQVYSTKEKKNLVMVQEWQSDSGAANAQFAFLNDDYMVYARGNGVLDIVQPESV
eukprot:Blabericola_migrator_1__11887@NODE_724_length_6723_cov_141_689153_g521_i0_p2_GENE_NODE_724_length_6723_cov_141_689153_g521_i0NODE_724_length_6723_cov_141_689153_g521_i0_p2_ORF_typecomplete_len559_score100_13ANAPC4_WD40/PF12894_7/0_0071ANAPC4_WD40/PF12894_7/0_014ANAPC4_WD40/PF12894_7/2_3e06ANAPC4_WD40/PF12894_7/6_9e02eIF2A/PF08662_11/2_1e06eIF2A/PF08662_11/2_7e06WD40_like/PF17005_5/2_7e05WD40_like/PF17005_5/0_018Ubox/PF04564_15/1_1e06WD40/PF00400_32/1_2e03WD40/PF00400_32/1_5WD40/PF00400_32/3_4e02